MSTFIRYLSQSIYSILIKMRLITGLNNCLLWEYPMQDRKYIKFTNIIFKTSIIISFDGLIKALSDL